MVLITEEYDSAIFPFLNKEGMLKHVAQYGFQRGWLQRGEANKWLLNLQLFRLFCNSSF